MREPSGDQAGNPNTTPGAGYDALEPPTASTVERAPSSSTTAMSPDSGGSAAVGGPGGSGDGALTAGGLDPFGVSDVDSAVGGAKADRDTVRPDGARNGPPPTASASPTTPATAASATAIRRRVRGPVTVAGRRDPLELGSGFCHRTNDTGRAHPTDLRR